MTLGQFLSLSFPVLEMETVVTATSVALQARACADSLMPAEHKYSLAAESGWGLSGVSAGGNSKVEQTGAGQRELLGDLYG